MRRAASSTAIAVLGLVLGAGCTQHQNLVSLDDDQHYLSFAGMSCLPDVLNGEPVEAGKQIQCIFVVEGVAKADVTLSCEDDAGESVDCSGSSGHLRLYSDTEFPDEIISPIFPIARCRFHMDTALAPGESIEPVVWVATDGAHTIRQRFAPELIPDDLVDEPPEIWVECGPRDLNELHPGEQLNCFVFIHDPDPSDTHAFTVTVVGNPGPPAPPQDMIPAQGYGPDIIPWRWRINPETPVGLWTFSFAIPGTTARYDLDVTLKW